jgi:glycosyltransferase involved in cell wall biosynthesis
MVSFIIPAYNEEQLIARCLESILKQKGCDYEIIVVDNNSTDHTAKVASSLADLVVPCTQQGLAAARNEGARHAKGDVLAFIDADAVLSPVWLQSCAIAMGERNRDAISGWNLFSEKDPLLFLYFNLYSVVFFLFFLISNLLGNRIVVGNNLLIRRDVFQKAGGFPCYVAEDIKLSAILTRNKVNVGWCGGMRINYSSRRFRSVGFLNTIFLWIKSVLQNIPESDYGIDYRYESRN